MNLDDLKVSWDTMETKFNASALLSEKVVLTMIRQQSHGTISVLQQKLNKAALFFLGLLVLFAAILAGNPFDYTRWYEYVPSLLYALVVIAALTIIVSFKMEISKVTLTKSDLREGLRKVIAMKERYEMTMARVWRISLFAGFLLGLSLMVRNFENDGLTKSILVVTANALTILVVYALAKFVFKQLPDVQLTELKMHLAELDDLDR